MALALKYASLLTTATVGVLMAATVLSHPAGLDSKQDGLKITPVADSPQKVAELLDGFAQSRFQKFGDGSFGVDRIVRVGGHDGVRFRGQTPEETKRLEAVMAANHDFVMMLLRMTHVPATAHFDGKGIKDLPPRVIHAGSAASAKPVESKDLYWQTLRFIDDRDYHPGRYVRNRSLRVGEKPTPAPFEIGQKEWQEACLAELPRLSKGQKVDKQAGDWLLAMRPIRAEQKACLNCHTQSKVGDTLGVMVYAVNRQSTPPVPTTVK
jgi:hypothetical protein